VVTGLSIDWSKIISTDQSNSVVATEVPIHWPKIFFFHQSIIHCLGSVLSGLSIDNSKNSFFSPVNFLALFFLKGMCVLGVGRVWFCLLFWF